MCTCVCEGCHNQGSSRNRLDRDTHTHGWKAGIWWTGVSAEETVAPQFGACIIELNRDARLLHAANKDGGFIGHNWIKEAGSANFRGAVPAEKQSAGHKHPREKKAISAIFCAHCQHSGSDPQGKLHHCPLSLPLGTRLYHSSVSLRLRNPGDGQAHVSNTHSLTHPELPPLSTHRDMFEQGYACA